MDQTLISSGDNTLMSFFSSFHFWLTDNFFLFHKYSLIDQSVNFQRLSQHKQISRSIILFLSHIGYNHDMIWNPWHGCHRYSEGCLHCYIHKGDYKRNVDTSIITKTKDFDKPIQKKKNGEYKMKSGLVYLCFSSDFFIVEADKWRKECCRCSSTRFV